jgi:N-acetylglucosamine-6-phosphate deacetylase
MIRLAGARLVLPDRVLGTGWLDVADGRIAAVADGAAPADGATTLHLSGQTIVPGFIDLHVHGGAGGAHERATVEDVERAVAFHRRHGTTRTLASVTTGPVSLMAAAAETIAGCAGRLPGLEGIHVEGPFLDHTRRGAQDPAALRAPDPRLLQELLDAGGGRVRQMTLAPELAGAGALAEVLAERGVVPAAGHTDATFAQAASAFAGPFRLATHLFNGMRPWHHRDGGAAGAALEHADAVELIADGHHVSHSAMRMVFRLVGARRVALITDAISAAGLPDGPTRVGALDVVVRDGEARLSDGSSLAGSTLTMDAGFRRLVREVGVGLVDAATAASSTPARVLGIDGRVGSLRTGLEADLVVLDEELRVSAVMVGGEWDGPAPGAEGPRAA